MNKNRQSWVIGAAFVAAIAGGAIGVAGTRGAAPPEVRTHSADVTVDTPTTLAVPDTTSTSTLADTATLAPLVSTTSTVVALDQRVTNLEHKVDQITTTTTGIPVSPSTTMAPRPEPTTTSTTAAEPSYCRDHPADYPGCQQATTSTTAG